MTAHVAFAHTGDAPFPCAVSACRPGARRRCCAPPGAMEPRARALLLPLLLLLGATSSGAAAEQAFVGCARLPPVPTVTFPDDGFLQCLAHWCARARCARLRCTLMAPAATQAPCPTLA